MSQGAETAQLSLWVYSPQGRDGRSKGWKEAKGGNPGEPAESLESPFFDHFIPFFSPLSLLCEAFQDLSLSAGISGGQPGPQARADGRAANQPARHRPSTERRALLPGASSTGLYVGFFSFFQENQNSQGKYIKKKKREKAVSPPPPPPC